MQKQITDKIDKFLTEHNPIKEEYEVVYLMVELRKLIDREKEDTNKDEYLLVRFHSDWILHTRKDHITPAIKEIMTNIANSIDVYPKNGNIDFLLLPEFKKELIMLLDNYGLPKDFTQTKTNWTNFMVALAGVLADQPIINPTDVIAEFCYVDIKKEGIMADIDFCGKRKGESITLGFAL